MNEEKWPQSIMSVALNGDVCAFAFYFEEHPSITLNYFCVFRGSIVVSWCCCCTKFAYEAAWTESIRSPYEKAGCLRLTSFLDPILVYLDVSKDRNRL